MVVTPWTTRNPCSASVSCLLGPAVPLPLAAPGAPRRVRAPMGPSSAGAAAPHLPHPQEKILGPMSARADLARYRDRSRPDRVGAHAPWARLPAAVPGSTGSAPPHPRKNSVPAAGVL